MLTFIKERMRGKGTVGLDKQVKVRGNVAPSS